MPAPCLCSVDAGSIDPVLVWCGSRMACLRGLRWQNNHTLVHPWPKVFALFLIVILDISNLSFFLWKIQIFIYRYVTLYMSNFTLTRWLFPCQCLFKVEYLWCFLIIPQIQYASMLNDWLFTPVYGCITASWRLCSNRSGLTLSAWNRSLTLWCSASLSYPLLINKYVLC